MSDIEIKVKIDGVEYSQEQLQNLAKGGEKAAEAMDEVNKSTKDATKQQGFFGKQLQSLKDRLDGFKATLGEIKTGFKNSVKGLKNFVSGMKTASGASKAFGTAAKAALAATGIGLLVVAVVSLIDYFRNLEGGAKTLKKVMAGLGAIVTNISKAFSLVVKGKFSEAFNVLKDSVVEAVDAVDDFYDSSAKLFRLQEKNIIQNAKINQQIEAQKKILEDSTKTTEERLAALDKVTAATKQLANNQKEETALALQQAKADLVTITNFEEKRQKQLEISELQARLIDQTTALKTIEYDAAKQGREIRQAEADEKQAAYEAEQARLAEIAKAKEEQDAKDAEAAQKVIDDQLRVSDTIQNLALSNINNKREQALESLRIAEDAALAELALLNATEDEKATVIAEYAKIRNKITADADMADAESAAQTLSFIAGAFEENTAAYKAIKITETTISTYVAAQKAYESASAIPGVGFLLGPAAAAAAVASGLKAVQNITQTQVPKYAFGGMVNGPSHSGGGSLIEAEGGEYIINKYAMRQPGVADIANSLNQSATPNGNGSGAAIKTYVVAQDVSNAQEANQKIKNLSRL